ncbi:MAG: DASS family sodium-coupled anion symporter [Verrucomicrobiales bacterium]|nr:DASS family sodium-coupled anion symporter [Verrucomicrobiales bacterium]
MTPLTDSPAPAAHLSPAEEKFEFWRRKAGFVLGPLLFLAVWFAPIPHLPDAAHRMLAVMALVGTWWLSEALPLAATSLLGPALCVVIGITPARDALRPFADPVIFLFLGGFLLAEAMVKHGLNRRIALAVLGLPWVGRSPLGLFAGFGFLTSFVSAWVSNTATAAMMLPIALSILRELATLSHPGSNAPADWRRSPLACGLILVTAFAASIGGIATPIGTPPNLIGIGLIERMLERRVSFFEWMHFAAPAALVLTALLIHHLHRALPKPIAWPKGGQAWLAAESSWLGPWTRPQKQVAMVFATAIVLWILPGLVALALGNAHPIASWLQSRLPEGVVALLAAVSLFALPASKNSGERTLTWPDATHIDWGTILLFGGGMALGELMFSTGLAKWIGEGLAAALPTQSVFSLTLLFAVVGVLVSEATSNTASATMIIPLAIAVSQAAHVDPLHPALGACLGCSLGFMLPVSTPPNALAYGTGAVPLLRMIRHGLWLDLIGCAVVIAAVHLLAPRTLP